MAEQGYSRRFRDHYLALEAERPYLVTLNRGADIRADRVTRRFTSEHPLNTFASLRAQTELPRLTEPRNTAFAGADHGFGFHEEATARTSSPITTPITWTSGRGSRATGCCS